MSSIKDTPLNRQYAAIKQQYGDAIVFFRVGDFYEVFYDDAVTVSRELSLTLTSRQEGQPMAGVPHHALDRYLNRLVQKGYRVAICDQMEDPKFAKGIVKRDVTKIVTPGTVVSEEEDICLASVFRSCNTIAYAYVDISIGSIYTGTAEDEVQLTAVFKKNPIRECIISEADKEFRAFVTSVFSTIFISSYPAWEYDEHIARERIKNYFDLVSIVPFGIDDNPAQVIAVGMLLKYVEETQKGKLDNICRVENEEIGKSMHIDAKTWQNLEIFNRLSDRAEENTLFSVMNRTVSGMGARMLKRWMQKPILDRALLESRWDAVDHALKNRSFREQLSHIIAQMPDFEKAMGRITYTKGRPKDLILLRNGIAPMEAIKTLCMDTSVGFLEDKAHDIVVLNDLYDLLQKSIADDPAAVIGDGDCIKAGYDARIDELRYLKQHSHDVLARIQEQEKERTGISTLKVKYNRVFGFFIEISRSYADKVPAHYERKQTLANGERFTIPELKDLERKILSAEEQLVTLEAEVFAGIRAHTVDRAQDILTDARVIGILDTILAFARNAAENNYTRPVIIDDNSFSVENARHPVIERLLTTEAFVPNDCMLNDEAPFHLITGPNMAGKSTYLRQNALLLIMAQTGSFVPAVKMVFSPVDRVFSRVGASDNLSAGESTFMTEMLETSYIIHNATQRSFIVLDEIGRGTSTYDGLSLAWAISEYIYENIHAKTLFATHYHELTELADVYPGICNYNVIVKEWDDKVIFLRKINPGRADKSYGIQVARLAGLPESIIERAKRILFNLESDSYKDGVPSLVASDRPAEQPIMAARDLFSNTFDQSIVNRIRFLDLNTITPVQLMREIEHIKQDITAHDPQA